MILNKDRIQKKFKELGSSVVFQDDLSSRRVVRKLPVTIDVRANGKGEEQFIIRYAPERDFELSVLDHRPQGRHLLLMLKTEKEEIPDSDGKVTTQEPSKVRFLCGHDERHFFACGVPEEAKVSTVEQARSALKPETVLASEIQTGVKPKDKTRRKTKGYIRQGEWFFIPRPNFTPDKDQPVRHDEPLSRGAGSKPHRVDELCSFGGTIVYFHPRLAPSGTDKSKMMEIIQKEKAPGRREPNFQTRIRDARVFVQGRVRHPDHKTMILPYWHEVFMNTESRSQAAEAIVFLD